MAPSDDTPQNASTLPTRTIYTAVVTVVIANLIAATTLLFRNPMDELDELKEDFKQHVQEFDARLDRIEGEHLLFEYQINNKHHIESNFLPSTDFQGVRPNRSLPEGRS